MVSVVLSNPEENTPGAKSSGRQSFASPTAEQVEDMKAKNADMVGYLQKATGYKLAPVKAATALAIADSLMLDPATRSFSALMDAWKECPSLHDFANAVINAFLDGEPSSGGRSLKAAPKLH